MRILPLSVMNVFRLPLVLRLCGSIVMADRNAAERLYVCRKAEECAELGCALHVRIYACPYSTEAKCFSSKKKVLCSRRAVLLPERILVSIKPGGLAAYYDCKRCLFQHLCKRKNLGHCVKLFTFSDHDKSPRLIVYCCRCCHSCLKHSLDVLVGHRL